MTRWPCRQPRHPDRGRLQRAGKSSLTLVGICVVAGLLGTHVAATGAESEIGAGPAGWVNDLSPIAAGDWDVAKAAHLLERAGFGGPPAEVEHLAALTPAAAVDWLVSYGRVLNDGVSGFDPSPIWDPAMDPFPKSRAEAVRVARERGGAIGVKMLPEGESRRLQPVVNKFSMACDRTPLRHSVSRCGGASGCSTPADRLRRN